MDSPSCSTCSSSSSACGSCWRPQAAAAGYGVPAKKDGDAVYLTIKGQRDSVYGLIGLALLFFVGAHAEAWFMLVVALLPLTDTVIVLRNGGTKAVAFGIHFATAVAVLICAALLFPSEPEKPCQRSH